MNELLIDRLRTARNECGLKQQDVAEQMGIKANTISNWEKGRTEPDIDSFVKLCEIYQIDCATLLSDVYAFKRIHNDISLSEYDSIKKYRSLDPHGQDMVDTILVKEYERVSKYGKLTAPSTIIEFHPKQDNNLLVLPYFRAGVSAGTGIFILGNEAEDDIELPALPEYEAADFAIDVNGDSMEPDFSHEDIALVQRDAEMLIGDIGVFIVNGDAFIKELGEKELISRNKKYKNIPIHEGDNVVCMGKVIGKVMY